MTRQPIWFDMCSVCVEDGPCGEPEYSERERGSERLDPSRGPETLPLDCTGLVPSAQEQGPVRTKPPTTSHRKCSFLKCQERQLSKKGVCKLQAKNEALNP